MRFQGKVVSWADDKGFGFVARNGSEEKLFLHISALSGGPVPRPRVGDLLTWKEGKDARGRLQAIDAAFVDRGMARAAAGRKRGDHAFAWLPSIAGITVSLVLAVAFWNRIELFAVGPTEKPLAPEPVKQGAFGVNEPIAPVGAGTSNAERFQCESGKTHCSHMRSCEEAMFYLNHCPGTKMDGNHNGVPCEARHCG